MASLVGVLLIGLAALALGNVIEFRAAGATDASLPVTARPTALRAARRRRRVRDRGAWWWFAALTAGYLLLAGYLVLHRQLLIGDAGARVAQAFYVIGSRDPHLAAIGFVWNPLPSLAAIPLVALRGIWPPLATSAFAGCVVSALCMAGAAVQLRAFLREAGLGGAAAVLLLLAFALNPMMLWYGANGMSEAMYLLFLVATVRYLHEWTVDGGLRGLVLTGLNLALAFLTRYEAVAAMLGVVVVVLIVGTIARDPALGRRERFRAAGADALVVAIPPVSAFVGWAFVSWLITGQPFLQFTSRYGNSSIVDAAGGTGGANGTGWPKAVLAAVQIGVYSPVALLLLVAGIFVVVRRADRRFLALVPLVAVLGFSFLAYVAGSTFGFLRYFVPVVPLAVMGTALLLAPRPGMRPAAPTWLRPGTAGVVFVTAVVALTSIVSTALTVTNSHLAPDEHRMLGPVLGLDQSRAERRSTELMASGRSIARRIDRLGLGAGAIALDTFDCGPLVVLASGNPRQFVITSDRDFERIVNDPPAFGVPYVLVPNGDRGIEAIGLVHPGIYDGGRVDDLNGKVVAEFRTPACPDYRLVRVTSAGGR